MGQHNRLFSSSRELRSSLQRRFTDATRTARAAGHPVRLLVETDLLRNYYLPEHPEDNGMDLVGLLVDCIFCTLAETLPATRIAYGEWLGVYFEFRVQHRRKPHTESLPLQVLIGPCTSPSATVYVMRGVEQMNVDDTPF